MFMLVRAHSTPKRHRESPAAAASGHPPPIAAALLSRSFFLSALSMAGPPPHQPSSSGDVEVAVESGSGASSSRNKLLSMVKKHSDLIGWTVIDAEADASDVEMDDKFWHEILDLFFVHGRVSKGREEDDLVFFVNNMVHFNLLIPLI
jgi:hypothetical protein